jgi:hypothetical protein
MWMKRNSHFSGDFVISFHRISDLKYNNNNHPNLERQAHITTYTTWESLHRLANITLDSFEHWPFNRSQSTPQFAAVQSFREQQQSSELGIYIWHCTNIDKKYNLLKYLGNFYDTGLFPSPTMWKRIVKTDVQSNEAKCGLYGFFVNICTMSDVNPKFGWLLLLYFRSFILRIKMRKGIA